MAEPIRVLQVIGIMNRGGAETMIMNLYRRIDRCKVQFDFVENSLSLRQFDEEILAAWRQNLPLPPLQRKESFFLRALVENFFPRASRRVSDCTWTPWQHSGNLPVNCKETWRVLHCT